MANELKGTLNPANMNLKPTNIGNFQKVMRDISRQTYEQRAKKEEKYSALSGAGAKASDVSGGTFASVMNSLEQMRGGDISKEYAAGVQGYKDTLDAQEKQRQEARANATAASENWKNAKDQYEWYTSKNMTVPQNVMAALGITNPQEIPDQTLSDNDKMVYQTLATKLKDGTVPAADYQAAKDAWIKQNQQGGIGWSITTTTEDDPRTAQQFDDKFGKLLSPEEASKMGITITPKIDITNLPVDQQDILKGKTQEQQQSFMNLSDIDKSDVAQLLSGDALLSTIVSGRGAAASTDRQRLLQEARKIDPTFSETENIRRNSFLTKWIDPNSKLGITRNSINTALGHLADVKEMTNELTPSDWQIINKGKNWWSVQSGSPTMNNLQFGLNALATEIATVYKGGTPTEDEIKNQEAVLGTQLSAGQFDGLLNTQAKFLSSKISSTRYSYSSAMGREYDQSIIDPDKKQALIDAGIDPNVISKEDVPEKNTHVTIGNVDYPIGSMIENEKGQRGIVNADGTITIQ